MFKWSLLIVRLFSLCRKRIMVCHHPIRVLDLSLNFPFSYLWKDLNITAFFSCLHSLDFSSLWCEVAVCLVGGCSSVCCIQFWNMLKFGLDFEVPSSSSWCHSALKFNQNHNQSCVIQSPQNSVSGFDPKEQSVAFHLEDSVCSFFGAYQEMAPRQMVHMCICSQSLTLQRC